VGLGLLLGLVAIALSRPVAGWFSDDAEVVALLSTSLVWVGLIQPVNAVAFALDGVLVGAGDQRFLAVAMVGSAVVLAAGAPLVGATDELWALWALLAVFMGSRALVLGLRYRGDRWLQVGELLIHRPRPADRRPRP
jgi:Na+-driven multidrug efflux pump